MVNTFISSKMNIHEIVINDDIESFEKYIKDCPVLHDRETLLLSCKSPFIFEYLRNKKIDVNTMTEYYINNNRQELVEYIAHRYPESLKNINDKLLNKILIEYPIETVRLVVEVANMTMYRVFPSYTDLRIEVINMIYNVGTKDTMFQHNVKHDLDKLELIFSDKDEEVYIVDMDTFDYTIMTKMFKYFKIQDTLEEYLDDSFYENNNDVSDHAREGILVRLLQCHIDHQIHISEPTLRYIICDGYITCIMLIHDKTDYIFNVYKNDMKNLIQSVADILIKSNRLHIIDGTIEEIKCKHYDMYLT